LRRKLRFARSAISCGVAVFSISAFIARPGTPNTWLTTLASLMLALSSSLSVRVLIRWVLVRDPEGGKEPQAFLCTDLEAEPTQILGWFVRRWRVEVTLAEVRRHLGVETQRQWSDLSILRTTPALLGLFSLVTLWAGRIKGEDGVLPDRVRWYLS
jgi:hypothetical protein